MERLEDEVRKMLERDVAEKQRLNRQFYFVVGIGCAVLLAFMANIYYQNLSIWTTKDNRRYVDSIRIEIFKNRAETRSIKWFLDSVAKAQRYEANGINTKSAISSQ